MNEFWRTILTNSSAIAAIILVAVGLIKTPLIKLKGNKWYKPLLTSLTVLVWAGSVVIAQLYVFNSALFTLDFYVLAGTTLLGVLTSYNVVYEGTRLKDLAHLLARKVANLLKTNPQEKITKFINKYGLDQITTALQQKQAEVTAPTQETETVVAESLVENKTI